MSKIKKILIANRGEIACRVIKTARKMGIKTVAVYSDADAKALHVRMADEAVHIGPSPAAESYLVMDKIIDACQQTGADAVHPGYGFLSENPDFARALKKAKITFIGPAAESMEAMGLKDAAKTLMTKAGVPVTPGYQGDNQDPEHLKEQADKIGYPVLIKAVAGGGGKGMRKVEDSTDFIDALASCQREAKSSFGNDIVLIEKYISSPRHIEVQVFGDTHGNVIHLFERDCSLQRRHQKVIEEAPAPGMTEKVRKAMTTAAVNAAKAVDYVGAGTVEFIVDGSGDLKDDGFWFMEMNTRLQVEHPVTEMITGLDLVELQIRVAQGEKLPEQKDIKINGHAIEARLYAEDPANDFLPSIGRLEVLGGFDEGLDVRIDTGVEQGDQVSIYYDPMIAKIIHHAEDRVAAISDLANSCQAARVYPVKTNARFMLDCLLDEDFIKGNVSTHFIGQKPHLLDDPLESDLASMAEALDPKFEDTGFDDQTGWRPNQPKRDHQVRYANGVEVRLAIGAAMADDDLRYWYQEDDDSPLFINGTAYMMDNLSLDASATSNANALTAPMPGKIISVEVAPGAAVKAGDKLIVLEAMKMEMSLDAPRDGVVAAIPVEAGQLVNDGDILLELEKEE